jgi:hypothetical protein
MRALRAGDIVRSKVTGEAYIVTAPYGERITAVRSADVTNPDEWDVVTPDTKRLAVMLRSDPVALQHFRFLWNSADADLIQNANFHRFIERVQQLMREAS